MSDYKHIKDYVLFDEQNSDLVGKNYRAGKLDKNGKVVKHVIYTEVYPFLYKNDEIWKRIELLLNGVKKSKISNLITPDIIDSKEKKIIYPFMRAKNFEQILDDSNKKDIPINFDLALSITMGIADLLETGSSIAVGGKRSFHGLLTPDNILIDIDGNIWIKNYGIYAYLNATEETNKELELKYGSWLTPEFFRKERPTPQSDIYHLGYMIYKMVTGNYFTHSADGDFDSKLSNISFLHHIPTNDKDFFENIIQLFKKTLNPNLQNRFSSVREFKAFISQHFNIEELSSVTFNIAYFMNSLYSQENDAEEEIINKEKTYVHKIKKSKKEQAEEDSHIVEDLLSGLDNREKSNNKNKIIFIALILIALVVGIAVVPGLLNKKSELKKLEKEKINERKKALAREIENQRIKKQLEDMKKNAALANQKAKEAEQKRLDLQKKIEAEKDLKKKEALKKKQEEQKKIVEEQKKKEQEAKIEEEKLKKQKAAEEAKQKEEQRKEEIRKKEEARKNALKEGDMVTDVDTKPVEINTNIEKLPKKLRKMMKKDKIKIVVSIILNEKGQVKKVKFITADVVPEIRLELSRLINLWKFKPATKYGKKVSTWFTKVFTIEK